MNKDFPRILTLLRKEKGISQKKAAESLGVSQALLSHYEKGIRECGLEFVTRAADFYQVSCDYLLGRSPNRDGTLLMLEDLPEPDAAGKENVFKGSVLPTLNKKLIENSLNILYDLLAQTGSRELVSEASGFLSLAVYLLFRQIYEADPKNPREMFAVDERQYDALVRAAFSVANMHVRCITKGYDTPGVKSLKPGKAPAITPQSLAQDYPLFYTSLTNLLRNVENALKKYTI